MLGREEQRDLQERLSSLSSISLLTRGSTTASHTVGRGTSAVIDIIDSVLQLLEEDGGQMLNSCSTSFIEDDLDDEAETLFRRMMEDDTSSTSQERKR